MYTLQSNQLLQQLTQITCGVVATVTNSPRVRTSTPRNLQKFKQVAPTSSSSSSQNNSKNCNNNVESSANLSALPSFLDSSNVGRLLSVQFSKLGISGFKSDPEFNQVVAQLAEKVMNKGVSRDWNKVEVNKIWDDVLDTVKKDTVLNSSVTGWSDNFLRREKATFLKRLRKEEAQDVPSPYLRLARGGLFSPSLFSPHPYQLQLQQLRTFKTRRDVEAAKERNPTVFSRVKDKFFSSRDKDGSKGEANPMTMPPTSGAVPLGQLGGSSDKMKGMLQDLPPGDQDKMKIAFAEGYMANSGGGTGGPGERSRAYRWLRTIQQVLAIAVFTAILASLMGSFGGGMFRVSVGNGNEVQPEDINVTFNDVKGVDEAKQELQEIVDFLKNPQKFLALGGKLPKGVLLVGPPGTGKTLLARAVAGEAEVPFFHAAGPEFDEILVGQGARRVRDLFKAAKAKAPCVIFIDEIDSVGAKRTNSVLHPYANQTINQLLSEMDGFRQNEGVIVLGATNRREDLDKALLRPGRFDVEVPVPAPEYVGRLEILEYYLSKVKAGNDVDVEMLARGTTGFTGADLENMINQAALKAAIDGADYVLKKHLDFARDKVIMGPQRKNRIPDEEANRITAYHEAGHAIAAYYTKESHPIHKVTIIPRGPSLGHTAYIPDKEQYHITKSQLQAMMDTMMGGRAAEELIFGMDKITSGASSDLKQATAIATHMVKEWGMSEKVGLRTVEDSSKASLVSVNDLGPQTTEQMDLEIKRILQESYERSKSILKSHAKEHKALAEALMMYETLDADDVKAILAGQPPSQVPPSKKEKLIPHPPPSSKSPTGGVPTPGGTKRLQPC